MINSEVSTIEHESANTYQQIISLGEALTRQGSKQVQLLGSLGMTLRELRLINEACVTQQLHSESKAAIRAARTDNHLSQLFNTAQCLQRTTGISHNLFQCGLVEADRRAAQ